MFSKIYGFFKRSWFYGISRWEVKQMKLNLSREIVTEEQEMAIGILKTQATKTNANIVMAPVSDEYFVQIQDQDIILEPGNISIVEGNYHYDIQIGPHTFQYLAKYLRRIIQRKRNVLKGKIHARIHKSLQSIYFNLIGK